MIRSGHRRANAGPDLDLVPKDLEGPCHLYQYALGDRLHIAGVEYAFHQNRKLVTAQACRRILGTERRQHPFGNRDQQYISGGVAQRVVDLLEAVQIQKQHAAALVRTARPARQGQVQPVKEQRAVWQSRQHVVHGVVRQAFLRLAAIADVAKGINVADPGPSHQQRCAVQAHIYKFARLVGAHRLHQSAPLLVHGLFQRRLLVEPRLRYNQVPQAAASGLLGRIAEHPRECGVGVQNVAAVHDRHGFGNAGQHIFHQLRLGRPLPAPGMGHNHRFAQLGVQNAVGAFHRQQLPALCRHRGVEWTAISRARQQCLGLGCTGKQPPQNVFHGALDPLAFRQPQHLPRLGVGKHNLARPLQKNQNRQCVKNLLLPAGVRVFWKNQARGLPWDNRRCGSRVLRSRLHFDFRCSQVVSRILAGDQPLFHPLKRVSGATKVLNVLPLHIDALNPRPLRPQFHSGKRAPRKSRPDASPM